jgi:hypothetical protein
MKPLSGLWLAITSLAPISLLVAACHGGGEQASEPRGVGKPVMASDWGGIVDGLRCRVRALRTTNSATAPAKIYLVISLDVGNVSNAGRAVSFAWKRASALGPSVNGGVDINLVESGGEDWTGLSNELLVQLDDPVFLVEPQSHDVSLLLKPGEAKTVQLQLGVSTNTFSKYVENRQTRVRVQGSSPPAAGSDNEFWRGHMETGPMALMR